jgi:hypothetical protein
MLGNRVVLTLHFDVRLTEQNQKFEQLGARTLLAQVCFVPTAAAAVKGDCSHVANHAAL